MGKRKFTSDTTLCMMVLPTFKYVMLFKKSVYIHEKQFSLICIEIDTLLQLQSIIS